VSCRDQRFTEEWDALNPFDRSYPHLWIKVEHLARYLFAANYLQRINAHRVADIGCGTGYGSIELADAGMDVLAVDRSAPVTFAPKSTSQQGTIEFVDASLGTGELNERCAAESIDAAVCFETIEHLVDPFRALEEIVRLLRPGGVLILSVPNSVVEQTNPEGLLSNKLHRRMFSISSITALLEASGLLVNEVLGQPLAAAIHENETRLIKRKQIDGRIGDEPEFHSEETVRRLAMVIGYPEPRDIERSYSIISIATKVDHR
jgi:2-polyprenyl-3-methyl-5-hydroxy-6-metoxy-1,4-benzoquinol methylase